MLDKVLLSAWGNSSLFRGVHGLQQLDALKIPCGPINTLDKVFADPQVKERQMVAEVPHPTAGTVMLVASPLKFFQTPCRIHRHPPLLGEHTEEVLSTVLGCTREEIEALRREGAI